MKKFSIYKIAISILFVTKIIVIIIHYYNWPAGLYPSISWSPEIFSAFYILYVKMSGNFIVVEPTPKNNLILGVGILVAFALYCLFLFYYGERSNFPERVFFGAIIFAGLLILIELRSRIKK